MLLIAADERISRFRHPIPTSKRVERMCMLVAGARMKGLICSATRIIHFGKLSADLVEKHRAVCTVDAALLAHTVPGETAGDAMKAGIAAYTAAGYPDEWTLHHQGADRLQAARVPRHGGEHTGDSPEQAFAWNPSITGTKSEDTVLRGISRRWC